jgi:predicted metal-dependent hydrolase
MADKTKTLELSNGKKVQATIRRDKRLKKTARWQREPDGSLLVRVPFRYPNSRLPELLITITAQLESQKERARRRTDADLQARAQYLNKKYFDGKISWEAIRWVPPMKTRLGSCTTGGTTDGHIRISEEIRNWPGWVVDYVIAHELTHRLHPNHSKEFWKTLTDAFPAAERARGFVRGVMFAQGRQWDEDE